MASPQVENGYTRIANELLEALMTADLNGTQFRIMLAVIRESYGRQRTSVNLSYTKIGVLVDQPRTVVGRNLKQLIDRNFLRHSGGELSTWSIQKDYSRWLGSDQSVTRHQTVTSDQTVPKSSDQTVPIGSDHSVTQLKKDERKKDSDVERRLKALTYSSNQVAVIDAAAADRGGFSIADVEVCEKWIDLQRPEWTGKYGALYKILKAGDLPVLPRATGPQPPPPQPVLTMADIKRREAELIANDPETAAFLAEVRASGW